MSQTQPTKTQRLLHKISFMLLLLLGLALFYLAGSLEGNNYPSLNATTPVIAGVFFAGMAFQVAAYLVINHYFHLIIPIEIRFDGTPDPADVYCRRFGTRVVLLSTLFFWVLMACCTLIGYKTGTHGTATWLYLIETGWILLALLPVVSRFLNRREQKKTECLDIEEFNNMMLHKRELAEQTVAQELKQMRLLRTAGNLLAILYCVVAVIMAILNSLFFDLYFIGLMAFICPYLMILGLFRFAPSHMPEAFLEESHMTLSEEEYPHLYDMARRAAALNQVNGRCYLELTGDSNIGITVQGDAILIYIGAYQLACLCEEELFASFLHEFAHIANARRNDVLQETRFINSRQMTADHFLTGVGMILYSYIDARYQYHHMLYSHAATIHEEYQADQAAVQNGYSHALASSLKKGHYLQMYHWEEVAYDSASTFAGTEPRRNPLSEDIRLLLSTIQAKRDKWDALLPNIIPGRSDTHPTTQQRLIAAGQETVTIMDCGGCPAYLAEREKGFRHLDDLFHEMILSEYEKDRQEIYLDPLQKVTEWEAAGMPLEAEGYPDIIAALRRLGRIEDTLQLCERVLSDETIVKSAKFSATLHKGMLLLHRCDPACLPLLYDAMESHSSIIDEVMPRIGLFCCITGNQEELERYRSLMPAFAMRYREECERNFWLKKGDHLTAETLPEGILERDLSRITEIGDGCIERVYLVHKDVTESYHISAYVIRLQKDLDEKKAENILHGIFRYLDSVSDWEYALFVEEDVKDAHVEKVPGSLVYEKNA